MKMPAFQFYPADWRKDLGVRALSLESRAIWFEMLCLMHESEVRGKLVINGHPMTQETIAAVLGLDNQILSRGLTSILEHGVASVEPKTGIIYCRRMVRDEEIRQIRVSAGKKGGNPNLVNQIGYPKVQPQSKLTGEDEDEDEDDVSGRGNAKGGGSRFTPTDVSSIYAAYPRKVGKGAAYLAIERALIRIASSPGAPEDPALWLLSRTDVYAKSPAGKAGKFTPHPATWFNQERYSDDPHEWTRISQPDTQQNGHSAADVRRSRERSLEYDDPSLDHA